MSRMHAIVGQPILAVAGLQPALADSAWPQEPPERRLQPRLAAPQDSTLGSKPMDYKQEIRGYVAEHFLPGGQGLEDTTPLISGGLIDSIRSEARRVGHA